MNQKIEIPEFLDYPTAAQLLDLKISQLEVWISTGAIEMVPRRGRLLKRMVKTHSVGKCLMRTGLDGDTVDQMIRDAITS